MMAKSTDLNTDDKIRVLKALAFRIHRKLPMDEALTEVLDQESMGGRNRAFRPAKEALDNEGFLAALLAVGLIGDEAASVMAAVIEGHDHRLLSNALTRLAEHLE